MKVRNFIGEYLTSCADNIVCVHLPDGISGKTFTIHEWRTEPFSEWFLEYEVSQIRAKVENFNKGLNVVIHIYTEHPYDDSMEKVLS